MCKVTFSKFDNEHANISTTTETLFIILITLVRGANFKIFARDTGTCGMCRFGPLRSLAFGNTTQLF